MTYNIETITTLMGAHRIGTADTHIDWLLNDSRSLTFPEETLFFAIRTQKNDGHRYISELYRRGVRNFVVSQAPEAPEADANYLIVPSPMKAMQRLAERHREEFNIPVIGITGSNGKTIVKEFTAFLELTNRRSALRLAPHRTDSTWYFRSRYQRGRRDGSSARYHTAHHWSDDASGISPR